MSSALVCPGTFPPFVALIVAFYVTDQAEAGFDSVYLVVGPSWPVVYAEQRRINIFIASVSGGILKCHLCLFDIGFRICEIFSVPYRYIILICLPGGVGVDHPFGDSLETGQYIDAVRLAGLVHGVVIPASAKRRVKGISSFFLFQFLPIHVMTDGRKGLHAFKPFVVDFRGVFFILKIPFKCVDTEGMFQQYWYMFSLIGINGLGL